MIKNWFTKQPSVGATIDVTFPGLKLMEPVEAKIDTGAYSGALHATKIHQVTGPEGEHWLEFTPLSSEKPVRLESYQEKRVTSSNGQSEVRFVINTEIGIAGAIYPISISLTDRKQLKYAVLIGRKFLETHKFVIDLASRA